MQACHDIKQITKCKMQEVVVVVVVIKGKGINLYIASRVQRL